MDKETLEAEIKRVQDIIAAAKPGSDDYAHYLEDLKNLETLRESSMKAEMEIKKTEKELKLAENKQAMDNIIRQDEIREKSKDSKRGVGKVILAGVLAIGQVALVACFEDIKPLFGKAWSYVRKTPDTKL